MKNVSFSMIILLCCTFFIQSCDKSEDTPKQTNQQPTTPISPIPSDAATNVTNVPVLSWNCSDPDPFDSLKYDIYFGPVNPPNTLLVSDWKQTNYALNSLDFNTTYYWRVTAHDLKGASAVGPIWRFTTFSDLPTEGLEAYYPFNGNANDESGNGNNGVVYGATLTTDRFGNPERAMSFNGSSSKIIVPHNTSLQPNNGLTVAAWVLYSSLNHTSSILGKGSDAQVGWYSLRYEATSQKIMYQVNFLGYNGGPRDVVNVDKPIQVNIWYLIIGVYDGTSMKVYLDGSLENELALNKTLGINNQDLQIGSCIEGYYLNGKLDDIRIYNRSLTDAEIQALYQQSN